MRLILFHTTSYQDVRKRDIASDGLFHEIETKFQLQADCGCALSVRCTGSKYVFKDKLFEVPKRKRTPLDSRINDFSAKDFVGAMICSFQ